MLFTYRRHLVVAALILLASIAGLTIRTAASSAAAPSIVSLLAETDWRITGAGTHGAWPGMAWQQWPVGDRQGEGAVLYVGATAQVQKVIHWSGELAYVGAGYETVRRAQASVALRDGTAVPISLVTVQRLADRQVLAYAVVTPHTVRAQATDDLLGTAWDALRGGGGPYYLLRVSVQDRAAAANAPDRTATRLLAAAVYQARLALAHGPA